MAVGISHCAEYELHKREWLTVLNTPPARATCSKWGLAQTTTLHTHTKATTGRSPRALDKQHKGNHHDRTQQQSTQPLHVQSHTKTTTGLRQPLHNLWQRSRHNRPHHRNRPLPQPHRRQHPGQLPGHVQKLQLQKRSTLLNSQNTRKNTKRNRNHTK